jgi:hypothetical protein
MTDTSFYFPNVGVETKRNKRRLKQESLVPLSWGSFLDIFVL